MEKKTDKTIVDFNDKNLAMDFYYDCIIETLEGAIAKINGGILSGYIAKRSISNTIDMIKSLKERNDGKGKEDR